VQVMAISYDSVEVLKRFAEKSQITFPLLSDAGSRTIDAFGIRNAGAPERWRGIPHPGTFILDRRGVVRAKLFHEGYRQRHTSADLVRAASSLP